MTPAVAAARGAVRAAVVDLTRPPAGGPVLVACSGGPDSVALAAATAFVAPRLGLRAGAVVVDHGWSPVSAAVAAGAAATCHDLGLAPVDVVRVHPDGAGGPEAAARAARYGALEDVAARHGARAVLLGHTLHDQAETVLLGLARGSGARSLAGMPARRGIFRRPLLGLSREETARACADLGLPVWHDPANTDPRYTRSRLRALLPDLAAALGPGLVAALARSAELAREDADALEALAADLLARAHAPVTTHAGRDHALDVALLAAAPDAVRRRALLAAARRAGSPAGALGRRHVLALDGLVVRWRGQGPVHLPGGVIGRRACGRLVLGPAGATPGPAGRAVDDRE
ncbi:MAG TPA: tRNA lysidine(34) synthetase TilS [Kineosporiaceae bacterium]